MVVCNSRHSNDNAIIINNQYMLLSITLWIVYISIYILIIIRIAILNFLTLIIFTLLIRYELSSLCTNELGNHKEFKGTKSFLIQPAKMITRDNWIHPSLSIASSTILLLLLSLLRNDILYHFSLEKFVILLDPIYSSQASSFLRKREKEMPQSSRVQCLSESRDYGLAKKILRTVDLLCVNYLLLSPNLQSSHLD